MPTSDFFHHRQGASTVVWYRVERTTPAGTCLPGSIGGLPRPGAAVGSATSEIQIDWK